MSSANTSSQQSPELELESEQQQKKTNQTKSKIPGWLLAILLIGGVSLWQVFATGSVPTAEFSSEAPPPKSVKTITLTSGTSNRQVRLLGQVEAGESATISPQLDGTVQRVLVREGDRVTARLAVAVLDDADSRLALAEARARLAQEKSNLARLQIGTRPEIIAQREAELDSAIARELEAQDNLERISGLTEAGALSQRALIEARAEANVVRSEKYRVEALLAEAQAGATQEEIDAQQGLVAAASAAVEQAQLRMQRTEIKAAFSGIVQSREVDPGDYVEVSDPVLTIISDRSLDIFLELPESLSGQVAAGMRVTLNARALPDWQQSIEITAVVPTANTASRRQLVRVSSDNPPPKLLPGMAIQANLAVPIESLDTFTVPRDALTRRGNEWLLFVVDNDRAQQLEVEIVADLGQEVVIANPQLQEGQSVVVTGGDGLTNDAVVQMVNNE
ncbi:RND family efflux transporter, MFP subunit [Hyella patelloides LEGE 07179]|uniref:RND family efflux transporter, MFP subunit n=1 Tax=Hyella patelloides LEGE 07179 TaxID=945734 RepID=A0A563VRB6_9CYAN|nr:efflux RND transporter periplasmic adaptor subunit [Hyella patelloides]VEP14012.1 RND family efflux transporter, MFP subunit [Hyella patelloides LEGE 07179]